MVNFRYGPVDLIAAAFDGDVPDPSVLAVIADLVDAGQIRVLDPLTGIANRRRINAELETSVELSIERGEQVWVIMLDLDNFKRLNDTMGHDIGDLALQRAAASLKTSIRSNDFCGRFGGEEFLAIIRGAEREDVAQIAERVRASIEDALSEYSSSASIGVALHHVPDSPQDVVNAADQAMYRAKTSGKNRVVLYDEEPESAAAAA